MIQLLRPEWPGLPGVQALSTLRSGGVSPAPWDDGLGGGGLNLGLGSGDSAQHVMENRRLLRTLLPAEPAWLKQVHGTRVVDAAQVGSEAPEADASFTNQANVVCAILTADCMPVLFADRAGKVVGAAHAGWRGLAGGVLEATLGAMRGAGAQDIMAWMGPAIGPQQFEVGEDVLSAFTAGDAGAASAFQSRAGVPGKYLCDLYALARQRLQANGVQAISGGGHCTMTQTTQFYSYRRDRVTGRMASLIWIPAR